MTGQIGQYLIHEDGSETLLIHFVHCQPDEVDAQIDRLRNMPGRPYRVACVPNMRQACALPTRAWPYQRTDDPRAVTCPVCKEDPEYKRLLVLLASPIAHAGCSPAVVVESRIAATEDEVVHLICRGGVLCSDRPAHEFRQRTDDWRAATCPVCLARRRVVA